MTSLSLCLSTSSTPCVRDALYLALKAPSSLCMRDDFCLFRDGIQSVPSLHLLISCEMIVSPYRGIIYYSSSPDMCDGYVSASRYHLGPARVIGNSIRFEAPYSS